VTAMVGIAPDGRFDAKLRGARRRAAVERVP
jgi:hypothetical protein